MKNDMRITMYNRSFFVLISLSLIAGLIAFALFAKTLPLIASKTLYFCQQFISNTLLEIPKSFPNTIILALGTALLLGVLSFLIQLWKTERLVKGLLAKQIRIPRKVKNIIDPLGLSNKVYVVKDENLFSFCFGIRAPHVIISARLVSKLSNKELEAVFLHEQGHIQGNDPLKILLGKTIASTFFFLPVFDELYRNMEATNELLADSWATGIQKDTKFLRSALRKIIAQHQMTFATVPAISHPEHIEIRVRQLVHSKIKCRLHLSSRSVITSIAFVVISLFVLQTTVDAFHTEDTPEPSYFLCSTDNACGQECHRISSQLPTYEAPSYK